MTLKIFNSSNCIYEPYVYVGRKRDSNFHWGNIFTHKENIKGTIKVKTRNEAVTLFYDWLHYGKCEPYSHLITQDHIEQRNWMIANKELLRGQNLACWCYPLMCHANVLMEWANV